jgi:hypothetical protein
MLEGWKAMTLESWIRQTALWLPKLPTGRRYLRFDHCNLSFVCHLVLGVWIFFIFVAMTEHRRYLPWTLEIPCWILDILFYSSSLPSHGPGQSSFFYQTSSPTTCD